MNLFKCCNDDTVLDQVANTLVNNWRIAHNLVSSYGGEFIAILQPSAYVGNPTFDRRWENNRPCMPEVHKIIYNKIRQNLDGVTWFHDMTYAYDIDIPLYIDGVHVSEKGNVIIAKKIVEIYGYK